MSVAYVYTTPVSITSVSVYIGLCLPAQQSTAMQLAQLYLGGNFLKGTLPASWSECRSVSLYLDTVSDQRKPLALHSEALKMAYVQTLEQIS